MATAALVNSDIEIGRRIVSSLSRAGIPVTVYLWAFVPQLDEWQFMVATPLVDSKGPLSAYNEINRVLQREGVFEDVPLRRIFLKSPNDPVLKALEKQSRAIPQESFRVVNEEIGGNFVEDAYVYGGSVSIVRTGSARPSSREYYSVVYSPRSGPRSPAPPLRFETMDDVRRFLEEDLRLGKHTSDAELEKLRSQQSTVIPISISPAQLKALGLG